MEKLEQQIIYPDGLTEKDKELINAQCEHQGATSKEQIEGFASAYYEAKNLASDLDRLKSLSAEDMENIILHFALLIESENEKGFRKVPVRFADFTKALDPELIPRAMETFSESYVEGGMSPTEYYIEFEKIHPFEDGNGRVGDLLWKMAMTREGGVWPEELPPDVFKKE